MGIYKAFRWLLHDLLLIKPEVYGPSTKKNLQLLSSEICFWNRKQCLQNLLKLLSVDKIKCLNVLIITGSKFLSSSYECLNKFHISFCTKKYHYRYTDDYNKIGNGMYSIVIMM